MEAQLRRGEGAYTARCAVYGLIFDNGWPLKDRTLMSLSRASLAGWSKLLSDQSQDPLPWVCLCSLVEAIFRKNRLRSAQTAAAAVVQFDAYLRPVEVLNLCLRNVALPASRVSSTYA